LPGNGRKDHDQAVDVYFIEQHLLDPCLERSDGNHHEEMPLVVDIDGLVQRSIKAGTRLKMLGEAIQRAPQDKGCNGLLTHLPATVQYPFAERAIRRCVRVRGKGKNPAAMAQFTHGTGRRTPFRPVSQGTNGFIETFQGGEQFMAGSTAKDPIQITEHAKPVSILDNSL
jgi:hypothetical protein